MRQARRKDEEFRTVEVASLTQVSYRQLDYWDRTGLLVPSIRPGQGSGGTKERLYSWGDVVRAGIARQMVDAGCALTLLKRVFAELDKIKSENVKYDGGFPRAINIFFEALRLTIHVADIEFRLSNRLGEYRAQSDIDPGFYEDTKSLIERSAKRVGAGSSAAR